MPYYRAVPEGLMMIPAGGFGMQNTNALTNPNLTPTKPVITKENLCAAARTWLAQHPLAQGALTAADCGVCPTCPAAEECPAPESQGYILPEACPTMDCPATIPCEAQGYVSKTEAEGGIAWWWLLVAAAGGAGLGYLLGSKKLG